MAPERSSPKASLVGANTVSGPGPLRVSVSPAAVSAAVSVVRAPAPKAVSTMSALAALVAPGLPFMIRTFLGKFV